LFRKRLLPLQNYRAGDRGDANIAKLPEELLRKLPRSKEWMRKHNIIRALASNPKTPFPIALSMLNRLTDFDLKNMMKDRNIPESIRKEAKKIFEVRNTPKTAVVKNIDTN